MFVLGLDLEGMNEDIKKGVNLQKDRVTEIGAVLWDWEAKTPVAMISELINEPDRLPISADNTAITGLTDDILDNWGQLPSPVAREENEQLHLLLGIEGVLDKLASYMVKADYIMAHNGGSHKRPNEGYDYQMLKAMFERFKIPFPTTPWIDTLTDCELNEEVLNHTRGGRNMMVLEHAHGFINPFPHRAVTDVLAMMKIFSRYDLDRMIELSNSVMCTVIAKFDPPRNWRDPQEVEEFNKIKSKVSAARFRWQPEKKTWEKRMKKLHVDEGHLDEYDFKCSVTVDTDPDEIPF